MTTLPSTRREGYGAWLIVAGALVFAAFALRVWNLDTQSLWHDEGWSVFAAYTPFGPMGIRGADVNAPFVYYATVGLGLRLMGDSVWAMRFCSVLYGVVTVALAGRIAGRWFGRTAGALAMLLTAFSPLLWVFSQEIRAYVAMPLAALVLLFLVDRLLAQRGLPGRREALGVWLTLFLVEMLALYAHNLSVPIVAWLNVVVLAALVIYRDGRRLAVWLIVQAAALILYLPWLLTQRQTGGALNTPPALDLTLLWNMWASYFTGIKALLAADDTFLVLIAVFGVLASVACLLAIRFIPTRRTWLTLSQVLLLPAFELAIIWAARIDFHPRYFIVGVPATMILVAAGLVGRKKRSVPITSLIGQLRAAAAAGVAVLGIVLFGHMVSLLYGNPIYQHDDFRAIAERYARLDPDDAIVIPYGWEPSLDYYQEKLNIRARVVEVPVHSSPEVIATRLVAGLQGVRRAEVLTWYQLPADVRGAFPCLLGAVGAVEESLTVSGLRTDRYTLNPDALSTLVLPSTLLDSGITPQAPVSFDSLQLTGRKLIGRGEARATPCLVSTWRAATPTPYDWNASVEVLRHGQWAAPQDSEVLDDRQLPTSLWPAEHEGASFTALLDPPRPLDASTAYLVLMKVYATSSDSLPKLASDALIGRLEPLGEGLALVDYDIEAIPRAFAEPDIELSARVEAEFPGMGTLVGAALDRPNAESGAPTIMLLWRASATPDVSYTVFVHLVAPDGRIVAQSDSPPDGGYRRTTTWLSGEYILDRHALTMNDPAYTGPVAIRVGLYDAQTGTRVPTQSGDEFALLPMSVPLELR